MMGAGKQELLEWIGRLEQVYAENRAWLTDLDSAIGDADHGINMDRGFKAVNAAILSAGASDIKSLLQRVATLLISNVGGASGPLYGTFFLRAAAVSAGRTDLDTAAAVELFRAGVEGVRQRGKAEAGDKTMVDAMLPALEAMQKSFNEGGSLDAVLAAGTAAAEQGMLDTIPMQARKGRASYLGPRSAGHQDPGATSFWLLMRSAAETWTGRA